MALLELIQETQCRPTRELVAQCLYDRVDRGNQVADVTDALEDLRRRNLLGYSEKQGYKIQSSAGEEWERERRDIGVPREEISELVQEATQVPARHSGPPASQGRVRSRGPASSPTAAGSRTRTWPTRETTPPSASTSASWPATSATESRWVVAERRDGAPRPAGLGLRRHRAGRRARARTRPLAGHGAEVSTPRRESLNAARKILLLQEENRAEELQKRAPRGHRGGVAGRAVLLPGARHHADGSRRAFAVALLAVGDRALPEPLSGTSSRPPLCRRSCCQLVEPDLSGPSPKFLTGELGILDLDSGRYVAACGGAWSTARSGAHRGRETGSAGRHCSPTSVARPTATRRRGEGLRRGAAPRREDPDPARGRRRDHRRPRCRASRDLFEKDRDFRRATFFPAGEDDIGPQTRARICKFFEDRLELPRWIARTTRSPTPSRAHFPQPRSGFAPSRASSTSFPARPPRPTEFDEAGGGPRAVRPALPADQDDGLLVKKHLDVLQDGVAALRIVTTRS